MSIDGRGWLLIGQVAKRTGLSSPTIRYYEEIGLIAKPKRSPSGYRQYSPDVVDQLRFVQLAQKLGLSLDEVQPLIRLIGSRTRPSATLLPHVRRHVAAAETRIRELKRFCAHLRAILGSS